MQLLTRHTPIQMTAKCFGAAFSYGVQGTCIPTGMGYLLQMVYF
jgi:hypothetical protein